MAHTKQVLLTTTLQASGAWQANRFINYSGTQANTGEAVFGVSVHESDQGDISAIDVIGIAIVEVGGQVEKGDLIAAGDQGLAVKYENAGVIAGRALDSANDLGASIRILLAKA